MTLELFAAGTILSGLVVYALTGGADFGGGVWDLLASGPRATAQREAIERALAPVWEANHVWLIFVIVTLFTAFPAAFARIGVELHVPLTLLLIGIVMRGSAFVFRQYGDPASQHRWGPVFAVSSVVASLFLGIVLGAVTAGGGWAGVFPVAVGVLALVSFAFLAAVYLTVEVTDERLRGDFRRRALASGLALVATAIACALLARSSAPAFAQRLFGSWTMAPLLLTGGLALLVTLASLHRRRPPVARAGAIATVALLVLGWGAAHYPMIVAPDLTLRTAAAPPATLRALVPIVLIGSVILLPSLWWLIRVFKSSRPA